MSESDTATPRAASVRSALRTALRVGEITLALAGGACLIAYGGACARASITQQRESDAFDAELQARIQAQVQEQLQQEAPPDHREWSPVRVAKYQASLEKPVRAIGRLEIPDVDLEVMVLEGDDDDTLDRAVGHVPGTASKPGKSGNLAIAGHRDGYFRGLRHLEEGDELSLTTLEGVARYRVEKITIVDPKRTDVLAHTADPTLTLVTCYPFFHVGDAPWRYIVRARQVSFETWSLDPGNVAAR
jgi:sortase A